jgi:hypothetical protein
LQKLSAGKTIFVAFFVAGYNKLRSARRAVIRPGQRVGNFRNRRRRAQGKVRRLVHFHWWNHLVLSVRPRIAELVFQLYGRSLHPELFEVQRTRQIERNGYTATVQITNAGHIVAWQYAGLTLTEVAASAHHPLPQRRRLISHKLKGACQDKLECRGGVVYQVQFSLEPVERETFWSYQNELTQSAASEGLLYCFEPNGRFGLGAMSYINLESRDRTFKVQAFHTFPDDYAIVKSQSVFTLPGK